MPDHDAGLREAIRHFWRTRDHQSKRQGSAEDRDRGARGAVTGGKQMDGFIRLVRDLLIAARVPEQCIAIDKRVELPGWFRAEKKWDLVIVHDDRREANLFQMQQQAVHIYSSGHAGTVPLAFTHARQCALMGRSLGRGQSVPDIQGPRKEAAS